MRINEGIEMSVWKEHFMRLLGGVKSREVKEREKGERWLEREGDTEGNIEWEEIRRIKDRIKEEKAAGIDEMPGEVWKYGGEEVIEWMREFCNRVWRGEEWPKHWKERIIIPIN